MSYENRKVMVGIIVSDKMDKTVTVSVERRIKHKVYGKYINQTRKFKAHDESNECKVGDTVSIVETRPMSRSKRWRVKEVLQRSIEA